VKVLLSILIALEPTKPYPILGALGRPVQGWFLRQLTTHSPDLAKLLHDHTGIKPYTVSTLLDDRGFPLSKGRWLQSGETCWVRLTLFESELIEIVLQKILKNLPSRMTLYKMNFRIDGYTLDPAQHPWANQITFPGIANAAYKSGTCRKVRMEFTSPTAFRSDGSDTPLPVPENVFRGYWQRWNRWAPESLVIDEIWPDFVSSCVKVSELTALNTERWTFADGTRGSATGFTGTVSFTLLPEAQCGEFIHYWHGAAQVLNTLAAFSFYCGTGHHTTIGMGSTRKI